MINEMNMINAEQARYNADNSFSKGEFLITQANIFNYIKEVSLGENTSDSENSSYQCCLDANSEINNGKYGFPLLKNKKFNDKIVAILKEQNFKIRYRGEGSLLVSWESES